MPTVGSLFSGIGGLDLGLEWAGFDIAWQCENNAFCRDVLEDHWPDVPCYESVEELPTDVRPVDVICGGFPCQPVSNAGRRQGPDDDRWLWPEMGRIVRVLRPRVVIVENVPGLIVRGLGIVLSDLAACGYDAEWDCIPAAFVGAPHLRYRVFVVAYAGRERHKPDSGNVFGFHGDGRLWPRPTTVDSDVVVGRGATVADSDGGGCEVVRVAQPTGVERPRGRIFDRRRRSWWVDQAARSADDLADAEGDDEWSVPVEDETWRRLSVGGREGTTGNVPDSRGAGLALGSTEGPTTSVENVREPTAGRGWWEFEPDVGRMAYGVSNRVDRLRALGNAVVPQVAEWLGRRILEAWPLL